MTALVLLGLLLALLVAGYIHYRLSARRRDALAQLAASSGWQFAARNDSWAGRFTRHPFDLGDQRRAANVMSSSDVVAFDYSYRTRDRTSGDSGSTTVHRVAVCGVRLPQPLPYLELAPERFTDRVGRLLGGQDVELESEDFNRRYRVRAADAKFASDMLPPRTMQKLLSLPATNLVIDNCYLLAWQPGVNDRVGLLARLAAARAVVSGVPSFLWSDYTHGGAPT